MLKNTHSSTTRPTKPEIGARQCLPEIIIFVKFVVSKVVIWKQTILNLLLISQNYGSNYPMDELYVENVTIKRKCLQNR
jgi:hypothetical protein